MDPSKSNPEWFFDKSGALWGDGKQQAIHFSWWREVFLWVNGEPLTLATEKNGSMVLDTEAISFMPKATQKQLRKLIRKKHQELKRRGGWKS